MADLIELLLESVNENENREKVFCPTHYHELTLRLAMRSLSFITSLAMVQMMRNVSATAIDKPLAQRTFTVSGAGDIRMYK
jgi:hypothetical protein